MCQDGAYLNLTEVLPDCFKRAEHTHELLSMLDKETRLMADESHVCSVHFLNECLERFSKRSEQEAVACVKRGMRPEKLLNVQDQQESIEDEAPVNSKKKGAKAKRSAKQAKETREEDKEGGIAKIQAKICPFSKQDISDLLAQDSASGQLTPPVDDLLLDQLAEFLLAPIRQQFWQTFVESSQRTSTKGSAKDNAATEKEAEKQHAFLRYVLKQAVTMEKQMEEDEFLAVWTPVKAHLSKQVAASLLNKLIMSQAFHNSIDFTVAFAPGKLTTVDDEPVVATAQDRAIAAKAFQKHI